MSTAISFAGYLVDTTVTDKAVDVDVWVRNIRRMYSGQQVIVGLDCEWKPNTSTYMNNKTAILQLCVDTKCLIIQLIYLSYIPQSLLDFLRDPNFTFVGVEVQRDVTKLEADYRLTCSNIADVRELTLSRWPGMFLRKPGVKDIAREVVGLSMPKPLDIGLSDWESRVLDRTQIEYACIDAYASYRIGNFLLKGL